LKSYEKFKFINKDIHDIDYSETLNDIEYIFHLAAQPGVRQSWGKFFDVYVKNNILATQKLLEESLHFKIKKFLYASSSSIYGNQHLEILKEDMVPKPLSPYGVTKLAAENLCSLYFENYGFPVVSLRLFTVFGPKQRPDMAFQKIINSIKNNSEFHIYGNGEQKRDFTFVDNVVNAFILAKDKGVNGKVYNIGGGETISLNNVIKIFEKLLNRKIRIGYSDLVKGDVKNTSADIEKAKTELGYDNTISLPDAIKKQLVFNSL
jgi:UDP-glucose 4-epimerase